MKSYFKLKEAYGSYKGYQSSSGASHGHAYGGGGSGRRHREDDEYHVPDPEQHKINFSVSKEGEEKHQRTVTVTTHKGYNHAVDSARSHLTNKGYTIHEEIDMNEGTFKYHMDKAIASAEKGDDKRKAYHLENARTAKLAMKTADYGKNKELLDKHKQMSEEKENTEYNYEGDMTRGQMRSIIANAQRVHDMLKDDDNLPEWVQSKVTLAEDYISTVANYLVSEVNEAKKMKGKDPCWDDYKMLGTKNKNGKQVPNCVPESVEIKEDAYMEAEQHLKQAEAAEKEGNVGMHHRHMTKFHERMSEWHSDRGRHGSAEKHETLADDHHEKAVKLGEATDARIRLQRAFEREKERRERSERLGRELLNPTKKPTPATPTQGVKEAVDNAVDEGIARLISKSIKRVTATKPTPQEKADIRLNK